MPVSPARSLAQCAAWLRLRANFRDELNRRPLSVAALRSVLSAFDRTAFQNAAAPLLPTEAALGGDDESSVFGLLERHGAAAAADFLRTAVAEAAAAQTPSPATDRDRMPPPPVLDAQQADGGADGEAESEDESEAETEAAEELPAQADDPMELDGAEEAEGSDDESAAAADHEPEDNHAMAESAPPRQLDPETRSERQRRRPSAGATWLADRRACAQIGWCADTTRSWRARPA